MSIKNHKNCNICANRDRCVRWKSLKVWLRDANERIEPLNLIQLAVDKITAGQKKAAVCLKYKRMTVGDIRWV